jgi:hypothetical protein
MKVKKESCDKDEYAEENFGLIFNLTKYLNCLNLLLAIANYKICWNAI